MNNSRNQSFIIYALLFIAIIAMVYFQMQQTPTTEEVLTINELAGQIETAKSNVSLSKLTIDCVSFILKAAPKLWNALPKRKAARPLSNNW